MRHTSMPAPVFERLPFLDPEPWRVAVINPTGRYARNQVAGLIAAGTPLSETAAATGFADQSHLTRHFAARFGLTPGRFAKLAR